VTIVDRIFGWLLVVGGLLHAAGSWRAFHSDPPQLLWALSGSLAALLVAALNLLRVARPNDRPLAIQEAKWRPDGKRWMSPTAALSAVPVSRPMPGMSWSCRTRASDAVLAPGGVQLIIGGISRGNKQHATP
jgi:hypothetical protein